MGIKAVLSKCFFYTSVLWENEDMLTSGGEYKVTEQIKT